MEYPCTHYSKLAGDDKDVDNKNSQKDGVETTNRRSVWNTFFWITGIIVGLFLIVSTIVAIAGIMWLRHEVKRFTTTEEGRESFPVHLLPEAELEVVKDRVELFGDMLRAGLTPEEDLVITQEEINGLIAHSDYLRGNANVNIEDGKFTMDVSLPAEFLPGGKGRYFVANGFMDIQVLPPDSDPSISKSLITTHLDTKYKVQNVNGAIWNAVTSLYRHKNEPETEHKLVLNIESGNFLDWAVPEDFIAEKQNLLDQILYDEDHHHNPHHHHRHHPHHHHRHHHHHNPNHHHHHHDHDHDDAKKIVESIESVTVERGRIVIHASPTGASMVTEMDKQKQSEEEGAFNGRFLRATTTAYQGFSGSRTARMLWKLLA